MDSINFFDLVDVNVIVTDLGGGGGHCSFVLFDICFRHSFYNSEFMIYVADEWYT